MDRLIVESELSATLPKTLPQLVPSSACFRCDVCCRFPEADSFLRPYFTQQEIAAAVAQGVTTASFPSAAGSQINLVQNPMGEGYLCPAFDPATNHCGIYEARPVDCQLYPLALMWDAAQERVLLGWDAKCPFMRDAVPSTIAAHAERVTSLLAADPMIETIAANPRLIGRFQDDVVVLKELPTLTARLTALRVDARLRPLTGADAPRFARALAHVLSPEALAAYAFAYHYIWTSLLPYWWMESHDTFFLFAQSPDGFFMPLLPLGSEPLSQSAGEAFELMRQWNGPSPVSRIENVMEPQKQELERVGFRCTQKGGDYLYKADALAALAGDRYKSQRALCNRVEREQIVVIEPYCASDHVGCLALYDRWATRKQGGNLDSMGRFLLEDAKVAHGRVFAEHDRVGLSGTVARLHGEIVAYTFGYWLTPQTFCVLLEVADRSISGLAQFLFRETCRAAMKRGARYINAMDDADLAGLREAKLAYRPTAVLDNWVVMRR